MKFSRLGTRIIGISCAAIMAFGCAIPAAAADNPFGRISGIPLATSSTTSATSTVSSEECSINVNLLVTKTIKLRSGPSKGSSATGKKVQAGDTFQSVKTVRNASGKLWYMNADGGYIYSGNVQVTSDVSIEGVSAPSGTLQEGKYFILGGVITPASGSVLQNVTVRILNDSGSVVMTNTDTASNNSYSLQGSALDNATTFNTLSGGGAKYTYQILVSEQVDNGYACCPVTDCVVYESTFTVGTAASTSSAASAEYTTWKQGDSRWGSMKLGNLCTMSNSGCLLTSIAIQMAASGTEDLSSFNPGVLRDRVESGGYVSHASTMTADGNLDYGSAFSRSASPRFYYAGTVDYTYTSFDGIRDSIASLQSQGYYVVVAVKNYGHYVAAAPVTTDNVPIYDPAGNGKSQLSEYDGGIMQAIYFAAS